MSRGKLPFRDQNLHTGGEPEQPESVRNGAPFLAQFGCQLVLCQTQRFEQILICLCLFHRVELFPLDVLNQGELQKLVVGNVSNDGRYLEQPRPLSGG